MMSCVFAGEMPVPEEHYGKGVPGVLKFPIRLEFPGDLSAWAILQFSLPTNFLRNYYRGLSS